MLRLSSPTVVLALLAIGCGGAAPQAVAIAKPPEPWPVVESAPPLEALEAGDAPKVELTGTTVLVNGQSAAQRVDDGEATRIEGLHAALLSTRAAWKAAHPGAAFPGTIDLYAPRSTPPRVVDRVVMTAGFAGYPHTRLVVSRGEGRGLGYVAVDARVPMADGAGPHVGRLAPEIIQRVVRASFGGFRRCYESGLARDPKLAGRVSVKFIIQTDGTVGPAQDAGSELSDELVIGCVVREMMRVTFPAPEGGIVTVVYPIIFSPGDAP